MTTWVIEIGIEMGIGTMSEMIMMTRTAIINDYNYVDDCVVYVVLTKKKN
jgi:hypothetical protein